MYTIFINGALAFAIVLGMLFCLADIEAAIEASETMYYPFLEIFYAAVKSRAGACVMASLVLALAIVSTVGIYASASRMMWSFARDRGLPFSSHLVKVSQRLSCHRVFPTPSYNILQRDVDQMELAHEELIASRRSYSDFSDYGSSITNCAWIRYRFKCSSLTDFRGSLFLLPVNLRFASMAALHWRFGAILWRWPRAVF